MKDHFIFNEIKIKKITTNTFQKLENGDFDILIYPTTIANKMKKSSSFALNNKNYFLLSKINYAIHKLKMNALPSSTIIC